MATTGSSRRNDLARHGIRKLFRADAAVRLMRSAEPVDYELARARMRALSAAIAAGESPEELWLLQHPALLTAGTSADDRELLQPRRFPVHRVGRGGKFTYHGPGQRVAYVMLDLRRRGGDVRAYIAALEQWIIDTLADFGVRAFRAENRVGVWVHDAAGREAKIAAIGVRVSRGVTRHGVALNVAPDLSHYAAIVPCGITGHGVISLRALGVGAEMAEVDAALIHHFGKIFGKISPDNQKVI